MVVLDANARVEADGVLADATLADGALVTSCCIKKNSGNATKISFPCIASQVLFQTTEWQNNCF